jgi:hypothetical protein
MMLFDSKTPTLPSGLNAAGTVPNGCALRKPFVLKRMVPENPLRACLACLADSARSPASSGRASKSHNHSLRLELLSAPRLTLNLIAVEALALNFPIAQS